MPTSDGPGYVIPPRLWRWAGTRRAAACFLWLVTLGTAAHHLWHSRNWFNDRPPLAEAMRRADGNNGHAQIDFGGQWVMARMIARGYGRELYHRQRQWEVTRDGFQTRWEPPAVAEEMFLPRHERRWFKSDEDVKHDADFMMSWFMGTDPKEWTTAGGAVALPLAAPPGDPFTALAFQHAAASVITPEVVETLKKPAVGGPLYPPVQGILYAPLALDDDPQRAYAAFQYIGLGLVFLAGLGVKRLSGGRIWWSAASLVILLYPGCRNGLDLAQNPTMSLTILVWGWVFAARGKRQEWWGGAVWGLFVFKPTWGMAFFLVPLITGRWRMCVAMVGAGGLIAAATLPVVGLQTWFDWLAVGKEAAALYDVNKNWIHLSRDLQGIPRRMLIDFDLPESERGRPHITRLAWGLWATVFVGTVTLYLLRGNRRNATGLGAGFLFLGAYMSCYRFMYYDLLLSAMAFALLYADPRHKPRPRPVELVPPDTPPAGPRWTASLNSVPLTVLVLLALVDTAAAGLRIQVTVALGYLERVATTSGSATAMVTPKVIGDTSLQYPLDAFLLLALWVWWAWRLWRDGDSPPE